MRCNHCGFENRQDVRYCEECGELLPQSQDSKARDGLFPGSSQTCPDCGTINREGIKYCESCGHLLIPKIESFPQQRISSGIPCKVCNTINRPGVNNCEQCGAPIGSSDKEISKTKQRKPAFAFAIAGILVLIIFGFRLWRLIPVLFKPPTIYSYTTEAQFRSEANNPTQPALVNDNSPETNKAEIQAPKAQIPPESTKKASQPLTPSKTAQPSKSTPIPTVIFEEEADDTIPPATIQGSNLTFERQYSFQGGGGEVPDDDRDGLSDLLELDLVNMFYPYLIFSSWETQDTANTMMRLFQASPISKFNTQGLPNFQNNGYYGPEGVLLTFAMVYDRDGGTVIPIPDTFETWIKEIEFEHDGDVEVLRMVVVEVPGKPNYWQPVMILIKRHHDPAEYYYPYEFTWSGGHPWVWVSARKHAMYSSYEACDNYNIAGILYFEYCDNVSLSIQDYQPENAAYVLNSNGSVTAGNITASPGFNVGERHAPNYYRFPENNKDLYRNQWVWSGSSESIKNGFDESKQFCGIYQGPAAAESGCSGGIHEKWWPLEDYAAQVELASKISSYAQNQYKAWYGSRYQVTFFTGNVKNAGTDFYIDLTLKGSKQTDQFFFGDLINQYAPAFVPGEFERNTQDIFNIGHYDLGNITGIKLHTYYHLSSLDKSEWFLDRVEVLDKSTNQTYIFSCTCWVDLTSHHDNDAGQTTVGPELDLQSNLPLLASEGWYQIGSGVDSFNAKGKEIIAVDPTTKDLYRYNGTPFSWTRIGSPAKSVAINDKGEVFAIAPDGNSIWKWNGSPDSWTQIGGYSAGLFAGGNELFSVEPGTGALWHYDFSPNWWTKIGELNANYAVSYLGELFAINQNGVWFWEGSIERGTPIRWSLISGASDGNIYAGGANLFVSDRSSGDIFYYLNSPYDWIKIGGPSSSFTVNSTGQLFSSSQNNGTWMWNGSQYDWTQISSIALRNLVGGNYQICGINPADDGIWCFDTQ